MPLSADIQEFIRGFGNIWNLDVNAACESFFEVQHVKQEKEGGWKDIEYTKGVKYGSHERNRLDVCFAIDYSLCLSYINLECGYRYIKLLRIRKKPLSYRSWCISMVEVFAPETMISLRTCTGT
ncbi:hypothetical protein BJX70DRAFT_354895 [Aspergillus crustosus]